MWNCGSLTPKLPPTRHNVQVRQSPEAASPALSPASAMIAMRISRLRGSSITRYRSRFCCSADIGRNGGRSRYAMNMLPPMISAISTPKIKNSTSRVTTIVL